MSSPTKLCPSCYNELPAKARFCNQCGSNLPSLPDVEHTTLNEEFESSSVRRTFPGWILIAAVVLLVFCLCGMIIFGISRFFQEYSFGVQEGSRLEDAVPAFETATQEPNRPTATESLVMLTNTPFPTLTAAPTVTENLRQAQISGLVYYAALRRSPGYRNKNDDHDILVEIPAGENVIILDGPQVADDLSWWLVSWRGHQGWVAEKTGSGKIILIFDP
jgi:hypothetical protein